MLTDVIPKIEAEIGQRIISQKPVHGGDIAQSFQLVDSEQQRYFLKYLHNNQNSLFEAEHDGLRRLAAANGAFKIPKAILVGNNPSFLLLEWVDMRSSALNYQQSFKAGKSLSELHKNINPMGYFGLEQDNFIGSITQPNQESTTWIDFYYEKRGLKQLQIGLKKGIFTSQDLKKWSLFVKAYERQIPKNIVPSLLHGDLWSGNVAYHPSNEESSYLYDPAVYYGFPEIDLAMTKLFGGFSKAFYDGYSEDCPTDIEGWENRLDFHQFYPILVHALLFGGSYVNQVKSLLNRYS